jgi:hypothetical protein
MAAMLGLSPRPVQNRDAHYDFMDDQLAQQGSDILTGDDTQSSSLNEQYLALEEELADGLESQLRYLERRDQNGTTLVPGELAKTLTSLLELQQGLSELPGFGSMKRRVEILERRLRKHQAIEPAAVVTSVPWRSKTISVADAGALQQVCPLPFAFRQGQLIRFLRYLRSFVTSIFADG